MSFPPPRVVPNSDHGFRLFSRPFDFGPARSQRRRMSAGEVYRISILAVLNTLVDSLLNRGVRSRVVRSLLVPIVSSSPRSCIEEGRSKDGRHAIVPLPFHQAAMPRRETIPNIPYWFGASTENKSLVSLEGRTTTKSYNRSHRSCLCHGRC